MDIEQAVLDKLRVLAPEKQQEVLDFAELLEQNNSIKRPRSSLKGLCADLGASIAEADNDKLD